MISTELQPGSELRLVAPRSPFAAVPQGVELDPTVDVQTEDPALLNGRRVCIARSRKGERCRASAAQGGMLCNAHSGRLDSRAGGKARAAKVRQEKEQAAERRILSRMGTRALIAQTLVEEADKVDRTVRLLLDAASSGDLQAAKALIPYLNQALGMPTERVEHRIPASEEDLETLNTAQLEAFVAEGRRKRLQALPVPDTDTNR